jgi:hypothetical protein
VINGYKFLGTFLKLLKSLEALSSGKSNLVFIQSSDWQTLIVILVFYGFLEEQLPEMISDQKCV